MAYESQEEECITISDQASHVGRFCREFPNRILEKPPWVMPFTVDCEGREAAQKGRGNESNANVFQPFAPSYQEDFDLYAYGCFEESMFDCCTPCITFHNGL